MTHERQGEPAMAWAERAVGQAAMDRWLRESLEGQYRLPQTALPQELARLLDLLDRH